MKSVRKHSFLTGTIRTIVFLLCLIFVIWRCSECFRRYASKPKGTQLSIESAASLLFPAVTICPLPWIHNYKHEDHYINIEELKKCGIEEYKYYVKNATWYGNCTDPLELKEKMLPQIQDLVLEVNIGFFGQAFKRTFWPNNTEFWQPVDMRNYGRCFTMNISADDQAYGISSIDIQVLKHIRVFFHSPNIFLALNNQARKWVEADESRVVLGDVEHEVFHFLDYKQKYCQDVSGYNYDKCILDHLYNESMAKLGCMTPFAPSKNIGENDICKNTSKALQAFKLYSKVMFMASAGTLQNCSHPCHYLTTRVIETLRAPSLLNHGRLNMDFEENIKMTKASYSYSELSLVAEIGGHVGLFLGVSVYQISFIFEYLVQKLMYNWH